MFDPGPSSRAGWRCGEQQIVEVVAEHANGRLPRFAKPLLYRSIETISELPGGSHRTTSQASAGRPFPMPTRVAMRWRTSAARALSACPAATPSGDSAGRERARVRCRESLERLGRTEIVGELDPFLPARRRSTPLPRSHHLTGRRRVPRLRTSHRIARALSAAAHRPRLVRCPASRLGRHARRRNASASASSPASLAIWLLCGAFGLWQVKA